jgi:MraZ protein
MAESLAARIMDPFVSQIEARLDAKGRVTLPLAFRQVLARDGFEGLYVHPSLDQTTLDAGGQALRATIDSILAQFSPFSQMWDQLSTALNGASEVLRIDPEGRIVLSETLKAHAGISQGVVFVGKGHKFQIWEPERFRLHLEVSKASLRDVQALLAGQNPLSAGAPKP